MSSQALRGARSESKIVAGFVSPDPKPIIFTPSLARNRAVAAPDFHGINLAFFFKPNDGCLGLDFRRAKCL